jgi:general secretion pathway protein A
LLYTSFFGLDEEPFGVTPDPKFLYISPKHEEAIATLTYGIEHNRGFIMLTGEVGSGKTTVVRHVFDHLGPEVRTAVVLNPRMDALELLKFINNDFGLQVKRNSTHKTLMDDLNDFLLQCHRSGTKAVLAIDEAQETSTECLEFVRLLSNLETDTSKLIQIILVGQPELRDLVGSDRLRQLDQRIAVRYHLEPLEMAETAGYIRHRLEVAGSTTIDFPDRGLKAIHGFSRGIPRLINLACDRTLLASFAHEELRISTGRIKEVIRDFKKEDVTGEQMTRDERQKDTEQSEARSLNLKPALAGIGILLLFGLLLYAGGKKESSTASVLKAENATVATADDDAPALVAEGGGGEGIFIKDGIYMAQSPPLCKDASLMNLLHAWGETGIDGSPVGESLRSRGYTVYDIDDIEKIARFEAPVVLELEEADATRHVTLRWIVGGYAVILDPQEGKQIVPYSWVKDRAVKAFLLYRKGGRSEKPSEDALIALLSRDGKSPSLTP